MGTLVHCLWECAAIQQFWMLVQECADRITPHACAASSCVLRHPSLLKSLHTHGAQWLQTALMVCRWLLVVGWKSCQSPSVFEWENGMKINRQFWMWQYDFMKRSLRNEWNVPKEAVEPLFTETENQPVKRAADVEADSAFYGSGPVCLPRLRPSLPWLKTADSYFSPLFVFLSLFFVSRCWRLWLFGNVNHSLHCMVVSLNILNVI